MRKILVIEDDEPVRAGILALLEAEDFDVIDAENGRVGVQFAQKHLPDLILCDLMMPELDGHSVLKLLRQTPVTATIPFIFLTAKAAKEDRRQGMELGADDYLVKPVISKELLGAIATRLEKHSTIQQQSEAKLRSLRSSITLSLPHELHTPLNGILGLSALLIEEHPLLEATEILEMAGIIHSSGQRLYRLIQNFLLYAQLEITAADPEQVKVLRSQRTNFSEIVIKEVALRKAKQACREDDLQLELQDTVVQISEDNLKKIAEELIDNALKYSPTGTPIRITGIHSVNVLLLSVTDYGRGMTAEQITNLGAYMQFERKNYEQQGSGLGLIIARRLAELHGGDLKIESILGEQTIVQVALPL